MDKIILTKPKGGDKKLKVQIGNRSIGFGAKGYSDYTKSKSDTKKNSYIARHKVNENWNKSGIKSAGFWSKHLLWNKKTLDQSIKDTEKRFNIDIVKKF
tara:strand:- start:57 stop:353 length:297 start_codon:yes stop_codon:yes gene_type:complete